VYNFLGDDENKPNMECMSCIYKTFDRESFYNKVCGCELIRHIGVHSASSMFSRHESYPTENPQSDQQRPGYYAMQCITNSPSPGNRFSLLTEARKTAKPQNTLPSRMAWGLLPACRHWTAGLVISVFILSRFI
jgi:hypothetical protein